MGEHITCWFLDVTCSLAGGRNDPLHLTELALIALLVSVRRAGKYLLHCKWKIKAVPLYFSDPIFRNLCFYCAFVSFFMTKRKNCASSMEKISKFL